MRRVALLTVGALVLWGLSLFFVTFGDGLPGVEAERHFQIRHPIRWWAMLAMGPTILVGGIILMFRSDQW